MRNKSIIALTILGLVLIFSCKKNKDENQPVQTSTPGYFILNPVNPSKSSINNNSPSKSTQANVFDLGEIKKSSEFYFALSNGGDAPIFDITLSFANSNYNIYPTNISILNVHENLTLSPIIKVGVIHGLNLGGIGTAPLLNQGINENTLSIYGKTLSGTDTIIVHLDVVMKVKALVADIALINKSNTINFSNYSMVGTVLFLDSTMNSGFTGLRAYIYTNPIKLTNTGNVPLEISIFNRTDITQPNYGFYGILQPGMSTDTLSLPLCQGGSYALIYGVKIKSGRTISDINKLQYGSDGNIYFALQNYCP
jgi:hypothetical protein